MFTLSSKSSLNFKRCKLYSTSKKKRYLAFDLESPQSIQLEGENFTLDKFAVGCAATIKSDGESKLWFNKTTNGEIGNIMTKDDLLSLIDYLHQASQEDYTIVSWNGTGFDFPLLSKECAEVVNQKGMIHQKCSQLALDHYDLMFQIMCMKGFCLSLEAVSKSMGVKVKSVISSKDIYEMWSKGQEERSKILNHALEDATATLQVFENVALKKRVKWITKADAPGHIVVPKVLNVSECLKLPLPDVSWMKPPVLSRNQFVGWIGLEDNVIE